MKAAAVLLLLALAPALLPGAGGDILLITLDTTRADHLSCYGHSRETTPALDALARQGVRFTRAYTPVPITLPSHAVLLTGLLPKDNGVRDNLADRLPDGVPTVAQRLKTAGYQTAAFVSAFVLDRRFGLARGFDRYDDRMTLDAAGGEEPNERPADATAAAAVEMIRSTPKDAPLFLWVHFYDPHHPYRIHPGSPAGMGAYDGEIRFMDQGVREVLEAWRVRRKGLVIAVGDHGEMLGEHGEETHGVFLYESAVHVPLLVRVEGGAAGTVVEAPVSTADVAATLLAFGGASLQGVWGRSLLDAATPSFNAPHAALYFESFLPANSFGWTAPFGILQDGWKYIHLPRPELYRLADDPGEASDRTAQDRPRARELSNALKQGYPPNYLPPAGTGDPEALKRLQSLGYKGGSVGGAGRDPKDLVWVVAAMDRGERLEREGKGAEAEPLYRKILQANPENYTVLVKLGTLLQRSGRREEARKHFAAARDLNPSFVHAHYNLASLALADGDTRGAEAGFRKVVELDPGHVDARLQLARLAINAKRFSEAESQLKAAEGLDPAEPNLPFLRGLLEAGRGNLPEAAAWFERTLERKPDYLDAVLNLAAARFALGQTDAAVAGYRRALALDPQRPETYLQLGAILLNARDDPAGAAALFREFLRRFPSRPEAPQVREMVEELGRAGL